ncbi:MAG: FeoB small GTPase domain-containing protein [Anaerolineales bacterium]
MKTLTIALAGNPNAGKSTIFNALTGENQHVGNWPGKTVEKKSGSFEHRGVQINIVDLPGVYSLSSFSPEEEVTRDFLVGEDIDLVVNVLDTSNLERNLYLTVQIREIGIPMMVLLNKSDIAERKGYKIDVGLLSEQLDNTPVIVSVAKKGAGIEELKDQIIANAKAQEAAPA